MGIKLHPWLKGGAPSDDMGPLAWTIWVHLLGLSIKF